MKEKNKYLKHLKEAGIGKAVRNFIDTHNLTPKGVTITADDIREGLVGVLSIFIAKYVYKKREEKTEKEEAEAPKPHEDTADSDEELW